MVTALRLSNPENVRANASAFDLGPVTAFVGPTARGELGQMFRLTTATGRWAVTQQFDRPLGQGA